MGNMKVTYSHAAPYIRNRAAYAMGRAVTAETQRDRMKGYAEADGLMHALSILLSSPSGANEIGDVADADTIPTEGLKALFDRWGDQMAIDDEHPLLPVVPEEIL